MQPFLEHDFLLCPRVLDRNELIQRLWFMCLYEKKQLFLATCGLSLWLDNSLMQFFLTLRIEIMLWIKLAIAWHFKPALPGPWCQPEQQTLPFIIFKHKHINIYCCLSCIIIYYVYLWLFLKLFQPGPLGRVSFILLCILWKACLPPSPGNRNSVLQTYTPCSKSVNSSLLDLGLNCSSFFNFLNGKLKLFIVSPENVEK